MGVPEQTAYERWGGQPFFTSLVDRFYEGVATDPVLRPMYPEDLTESKAHLALFLEQYWGGPRDYSDQSGHPRLRMLHAPFPIGSVAAGLAPADEEELLGYLTMAARSLINDPS